MEAELVDYICSKYGKSNLRKMLVLHKAGVPEAYWGATVPIIDAKKFNDKRIVTVMGTNADQVNSEIVGVVKRMIAQGRRAKYFDFLSLLSDNVSYGMVKEGFIRKHSPYGVIAVTGVSYGETYDKNSSIFPMLVNSLSTAGVNSTIIVGMELVGEDQFVTAYGPHYKRLIIESSQSICYKLIFGTLSPIKIK